MASPVKFNFDDMFDGGVRSKQAAEADRRMAEMDAVRASAHAEGVEAGRIAALGEIEQQTLEAAERLTGRIAALEAEMKAIRTNMLAEAVPLLLDMAEAIAGHAMDRNVYAGVDALVDEIMAGQCPQPSLAITGPEKLLMALRNRIETAAEAYAYDGTIQYRAGQDLTPSDISIEWAGGGIEYTLAERLSAVRKATGDYLDNLKHREEADRNVGS